jgi:ABC-type multidrug transport system fused ATPase/permease subunit
MKNFLNSIKSRFLRIDKIRIFASTITLLSLRDKLWLSLVVSINIFIALVDLIGVALIGVLGSLSVTGLAGVEIGNRVSSVMNFLKLQDLDLQDQVAVIAALSGSLLILKSITSLYLVRRVTFFMARISAKMSASLILRYFTLSVSNVNQRSIQSSIYSLTDGISKLMNGVVGAVVNLSSDLILLIVMLSGLFFIDVTASFTAIIIFGTASIVLYFKVHKETKSLASNQSKLSIESSQKIYQAISAYRELLVRDRRFYYGKEIGSLRLKLAEGGARIKFVGALSKYVMEITLVVACLALGLYLFLTKTSFSAIATLTVFLAASTRVIPAILRLQQGLLGIKASLGEAEPTLLLIQEIGAINVINREAGILSRFHPGFVPRVTTSGLSFGYKTKTEVIKNIEFQVRANEFVGIVGGTGAGKSTLLDVILGALDPSSGSVEISGLPPVDAFTKWPGAVGYVSQESPVIGGTIRENLGFGYPLSEIKDEFCWECLDTSSLKTFVKQLPDGLEHYVGDRGTKLSGGQRQRLGIARALITKPKLLILDEATSSLDGKTESEIMECLLKLKEYTSLIVVAHRLSTLLHADRIYFMESGEVKDVGTFSELKERNLAFSTQAALMGL